MPQPQPRHSYDDAMKLIPSNFYEQTFKILSSSADSIGWLTVPVSSKKCRINTADRKVRVIYYNSHCQIKKSAKRLQVLMPLAVINEKKSQTLLKNTMTPSSMFLRENMRYLASHNTGVLNLYRQCSLLSSTTPSSTINNEKKVRPTYIPRFVLCRIFFFRKSLWKT